MILERAGPASLGVSAAPASLFVAGIAGLFVAGIAGLFVTLLALEWYMLGAGSPPTDEEVRHEHPADQRLLDRQA
jgi:hypothetical protein